MLVEIKIDINKLNPLHADYDNTLFGLCQQAVISGATTTYKDGYVTYKIYSANLSMGIAQSIVGLGAEVNKMPFFIKVSSTSANVPVGIPNREYQSEAGDPVVHTWESWKRDNFDFHTLTDGNTYIAAEANTGDVVKLNDFMSEASNLIDTMTFKSLQPTE